MKPIYDLQWATDSVTTGPSGNPNKLEPFDLKSEGLEEGEPVSRQAINFQFDAIRQWKDYLEDTTDDLLLSSAAALTKSQNLADLIDVAVARTNLGLNVSSTYSIASQAVAQSGTASTSLMSPQRTTDHFNARTSAITRAILQRTNVSDIRSDLGLGNLAVLSSVDNSNWSGIALSVSNGGTGATSAASARTNLGLGSIATKSTINDSDWSGTDLSVSNGGTGASTLSGLLKGNGTSAISSALAGDIISTLGFSPVQQGTGVGQRPNTVKIGWDDSSKLLLTVDNTDFGANWPLSLDASRISSGVLPLARGGTGANNAAGVRNNIGLTTSATTDKQSSTSDTTSGRLLINGAHGLGGQVIPNGDWNTIVTTGFYGIVNSSQPELPLAVSSLAVQHIEHTSDFASQIAYRTAQPDTSTWRRTRSGGTWSGWTRFYTDNNILNIGTTASSARSALGLGTAATQPSTAFAASSLNINSGDGLSGGGNLTANRTLSVDSSVVRTSGNQTISGTKTFTSTVGANITGNAGSASTLQTARNINLSGDVTGTVSFNGSSNVTMVTTVADNSHNHTIANVSGLQTAIDSKANTNGSNASGTWPINITGSAQTAVSATTAGSCTNAAFATNVGNIDSFFSGKDLSTNGFQSFVGGFTIMWGQVTVSGDSTLNIGWPYLFNNVCLQATATLGQSFDTQTDAGVAIYNLTRTGATIQNGCTTSKVIRYMAFGF